MARTRKTLLGKVLRVVCEGLHWLGRSNQVGVRASKSAISQARIRLGADVMRKDNVRETLRAHQAQLRG